MYFSVYFGWIRLPVHRCNNGSDTCEHAAVPLGQ